MGGRLEGDKGLNRMEEWGRGKFQHEGEGRRKGERNDMTKQIKWMGK
jgi:hypothetical protein